jgi:hypothetical protein
MLHFTEYFAVHSGEPGFVYVLLMDGIERIVERFLIPMCIINGSFWGKCYDVGAIYQAV